DGAGAMRRIRANRNAVLPFRMPRDPVANLPGQIQPVSIVLEHVDDAKALLVVLESTRYERLQDPLAGVAERRRAQVLPERDGFGQLLIKPQHLGNAARDLRDLERVGQARAVVIAGRRKEDLRLVLQPAKGLAVNDAIAVVLKRGPDRIFLLG